jgi:hypothetical protein
VFLEKYVEVWEESEALEKCKVNNFQKNQK